MQAMAAACNMFTGAELAGLCREAAITALREDLQVVQPQCSWHVQAVLVNAIHSVLTVQCVFCNCTAASGIVACCKRLVS